MKAPIRILSLLAGVGMVGRADVPLTEDGQPRAGGDLQHVAHLGRARASADARLVEGELAGANAEFGQRRNHHQRWFVTLCVPTLAQRPKEPVSEAFMGG